MSAVVGLFFVCICMLWTGIIEYYCTAISWKIQTFILFHEVKLKFKLLTFCATHDAAP